MKRLLAAVVGLLAALPLTLAATAAPAQAVTQYTFTGPSGVLYSACNDYAYTFSTTPATYVTWQLEVTDPDGLHADSIFEITASGTGSIYMCGGVSKVGTYNVTGTLKRCFGTYSCDTTPVTSSFTLVTPATQTELKASPTKVQYEDRVKLKVQTYDQVPAGFAPSDTAPSVVFEAELNGKWKKLPKGKVDCDSKGVAVAKYIWNFRGTVQVRAVRRGSMEGAPSTSKVVKVKTVT